MQTYFWKVSETRRSGCSFAKSMGGTTGFAKNLARDIGPRLAHAVLPIANKADNDWQYGILVPGIAPFFGAAAAAVFMRSFFGI